MTNLNKTYLIISLGAGIALLVAFVLFSVLWNIRVPNSEWHTESFDPPVAAMMTSNWQIFKQLETGLKYNCTHSWKIISKVGPNKYKWGFMIEIDILEVPRNAVDQKAAQTEEIILVDGTSVEVSKESPKSLEFEYCLCDQDDFELTFKNKHAYEFRDKLWKKGVYTIQNTGTFDEDTAKRATYGKVKTYIGNELID